MTNTSDDLIEQLNSAAYKFDDSYPVWAALQREAAAEITHLRERVAELERENARQREAISEGLANLRLELLRAERAEQELSRARYQLRWRAEDVGTTHYPECWRDHYACAMHEIEELKRENTDLLKSLDANWVQHQRVVRVEAERDALRAENEGLRQDAERYSALVTLWLMSVELSLTQDEDGRWSITCIEPVEALPSPGKWTGDDPDAAIDAARAGSKA